MTTSVPSSDIDDDEDKEDERVPGIMSRSTPAHVSMFSRSPVQYSGRSKEKNRSTLLRDEATGFYENFCFKNFFGDFSGGPSLNVMQTK